MGTPRIPDVPSPLTCEGPGEGGAPCGRTVRAQADGRPLCASHYQQARRGRPLAPLGQGRPSRNRLPGVLVSDGCHAALIHLGPTLYHATCHVLETWARRMQKTSTTK